ncbi:MAG: alpha/beta hydrolase [Acidobacteriales bacterium]|nr:alpha/beta hydrolase [Terriglobales bacterium]
MSFTNASVAEIMARIQVPHDPDNPRLRTHSNFRSKFLPEHRDIVVYLPVGYDEHPTRHYPVLYLNDGQNLFDPTTAFGGNDWRVDETADALITAHIVEPIIMVGVYNTGNKRIEEYTPTADERMGGGHADRYGRMLVEEIKPFIDQRYRTHTDPHNTGLGGSSLGGLVSIYLGFTYPHVFGKLAVLSPSVWWNNKSILDIVSATLPKPRLKIWLDIGTRETDTAVGDAELLCDVLVEHGWRLGDDLHFCEAEGAEHNEQAWASRIGSVLEYLFPAHHYGN